MKGEILGHEGETDLCLRQGKPEKEVDVANEVKVGNSGNDSSLFLLAWICVDASQISA